MALPFFVGIQMERSTEMFGEEIGKIIAFAFLSTFEKVTRSTRLRQGAPRGNTGSFTIS